MTLRPWPLIFQPQNHTTCRISQGHSLYYQVWTLWYHSFSSYAADRRTQTDVDERFTPMNAVWSEAITCVCVLRLTGSSDGAEEWWNGCDGLGWEHPVLVDRIQRCRIESGARWSGLVAAAEPGILPARIHVHHVLGQHRLRALDTVNSRRRTWPVFQRRQIQLPHILYICAMLTNKAISRTLLCPRPVNYLMEYAFTFTFASRKFPPISVYAALSTTALIGVVTLTFDLLTSK